MKRTRGQIEDEIAKKCIIHYKENLGSGPRQIKVYVIQDLIILRLNSDLKPYEKILLKRKQGIELVKQIRKEIHESTLGGLSEIIETITGCKVISFHSDVSTKTGERFKIFVLDQDFEATIT